MPQILTVYTRVINLLQQFNNKNYKVNDKLGIYFHDTPVIFNSFALQLPPAQLDLRIMKYLNSDRTDRHIDLCVPQSTVSVEST